MNINEEMKDFFVNDEIKVILDHPLVFKNKLQLSDNNYEYLNIAKNLDKYSASLLAALAGASIVYATFLANLGVIGTIGLYFGLLSNPIGWMALAGGTGAILMFGGKHIVDKVDKNLNHKIPKYINTPIDLLATTLLNYILPLAVKVSLIDNQLNKEEENCISQYFNLEWGYNNDYLNLMINQIVKNESKFEFDDLKKKLEAIVENTKGLQYNIMKSEITNILRKLCDINNKEAQKYSKMIDIITNL